MDEIPDGEPLVDSEDEPVLDGHVPTSESLSHTGHKVTAPFINVVNSLKINILQLLPGGLLKSLLVGRSLTWFWLRTDWIRSQTCHYTSTLGQGESRIDSHPKQILT